MTKREAERRWKKLCGRTIVKVEANPFATLQWRGDEWTCDPVLTLDDGSRIRITVDETEYGEYGVTCVWLDPIQPTG